MEQNRNIFESEAAVAGAADEALPRPSATSFNLSSAPDAPDAPGAGSGDPPSILDFDPVVLRVRCDGWTPARQGAFIEALADCGVVREAAARVGMTEQSAGRLRRRAGAESFARAWELALREGTDRLRSLAYERCINGTLKPVFYRGRIVGHYRVYDNRLLVHLLGKTRPFEAPPEVREVARDWDRWMQAIGDGLDRPPPRPIVWKAEDGSWWTNAAPPAGFNGLQSGDYGAEHYRRACTLGETEAIEAARARDRQAGERERDRYFAALESGSDSRCAELSEPSGREGAVIHRNLRSYRFQAGGADDLG